MPYELREHTADVAVEATGETLGDTFGAVADGMAAAMCDDIPETGERREVSVSAESREALLFDYLDELIYERDVQLVLPVDNCGIVDRTDQETDEDSGEWEFSGSYRGVPLSEIDAREVKAVTYSEMEIAERDGGWFAYVVLDV